MDRRVRFQDSVYLLSFFSKLNNTPIPIIGGGFFFVDLDLEKIYN